MDNPATSYHEGTLLGPSKVEMEMGNMIPLAIRGYMKP